MLELKSSRWTRQKFGAVGKRRNIMEKLSGGGGLIIRSWTDMDEWMDDLVVLEVRMAADRGAFFGALAWGL